MAPWLSQRRRLAFCPCQCYHINAVLTPTTVDRAFPVVLRHRRTLKTGASCSPN